MIAFLVGLLDSSERTDNFKPFALEAWPLRRPWVFCRYMNMTMVLLRLFLELTHYCDIFIVGQPCFEWNSFTESENCNHCMFITPVSCFYWSTQAQYIIMWTYWSNQMCSGRKNKINVLFESCYFEIMALRIWERELNALHSNANLRFMSQSILSSLFHPTANANYWHKNLQRRIVVIK
jgi:hypothetical protein